MATAGLASTCQPAPDNRIQLPYVETVVSPRGAKKPNLLPPRVAAARNSTWRASAIVSAQTSARTLANTGAPASSDNDSPTRLMPSRATLRISTSSTTALAAQPERGAFIADHIPEISTGGSASSVEP